MNCYQRFWRLVTVIACSRYPSNAFLWCCALLACIGCFALMFQQQAGVQWLPALLVICWSLMLLFIRYCPIPQPPVPLGRPWLDWWRRQFFCVKLHSFSVLVLALILGTAFTTLKIISVLLRQH